MADNLSLCPGGVNPRKVKLLDEFLLPGAVLDIGCGNGLYGVPLAGRGQKVLQLDVLDRRSQLAKHLPFVQGDAGNLASLQLGHFQNVVAFDVMEHLDDDEAFLSATRTICDGRLILSVPNEDDRQLLGVGVTHMHHIDKTHRRAYGRNALQARLQRCGWRIVCLRPQVNELLPYFARMFADDRWMSRLASRVVSAQCLMLLKCGIFRNTSAADWFCVAE